MTNSQDSKISLSNNPSCLKELVKLAGAEYSSELSTTIQSVNHRFIIKFMNASKPYILN